MIRKLTVIVLAACLTGGPLFAHDECGRGKWHWFGEKPKKPATFFETVVHGTALGAYTGLAGGWVRYASDAAQMQKVWQSAGYGALGGLGFGIAAASIGTEGRGDLMIADVERVGSVGGGVGFLWGVVAALFTGESPRIADGMAWGQLGGVAAGLCLAGYKTAAGAYAEPVKSSAKEEKLQASAGYAVDSAADVYPCLRVTKRF